jgi:hypothetical protein
LSTKVTSWIALIAMLLIAGVLTFQILEKLHYEDNNAPNKTVWSK